MRLVFTYILTLGCGIALAAGTAMLVGLAFPSARTWVFLVLAIWWLWVGYKYAAARDRGVL